MSPTFIRAFRVRKRQLLALAALAFFSLALFRVIEDKLERRSVAATSWAVASKVVVVDAGHGGVDPGVVGKDGALEKEITLEVSKRLASYLGQAGAMVLMTRETDTDLAGRDTVSLAARKREDLKRRVALANDNRADLYVSIHVNSFPDPGRRGAQTFVQKGSADSKQAAGSIQAELARVLKNTDRLPKEVDYYITRNAAMPTVLVEIGFITNGEEEKLLLDPAYQSKVAWAVYAGVVRHFARLGASPHGTPDKEKVIKTFKEKEPSLVKEP